MVELLKNLKKWVSSLIRIHLLYPRSLDATCQVYSIIPDVMKKATHTTVGSGIKFLVWNELRSFGNCNYIGDRTIIDNCTSIGSFCSISMDVKIGLRNHSLDTVSTSPFFYRKSKGFTSKDNLEQSRSVVIENDVLISANVVVLESVRLHTGCIIAAGAVVTSDVPPYAIVGGVPAKILKYRFSEEIIDALLSSEWWNSDLNKIKNANSLFNDPLKFIEEIKS